MTQENFQIAKNIVSSYGARIQVVKIIVEDTRKLLDEFRQKREKMAEGLREFLANFQSLRKKDFNQMMADILTAQRKREENVKEMLAGFEEEEALVATNLKTMLEKGEALRLQDFKRTLIKIRQGQEERQKENSKKIQDEILRMQFEVRAMLEDFRKEKEKAVRGRQKMAAIAASKINFQSGRFNSEINSQKK